MRNYKNLKKEREGVSSILIVVAAVVVIALIAAALLGAFGASGDSNVQVKATVYVKNMSTGELVSGTVDMSNPTGTEQLMMSIGQGQRDTPLKPLEFTQTIPNVNAVTQYAVWASAAVDYSVSGISKAQINARFTAKDGTGMALRIDNALNTDRATSQVTVDNIPLTPGSYVLVNMDPAKAFSWRNVDLTGGVNQNGHAGSVPDGIADPWLGVYVGGTVIHVDVDVNGWSTGSSAATWDVQAKASGDLRIVVNQQTGTITAQVSSMWSSGTGWQPN